MRLVILLIQWVPIDASFCAGAVVGHVCWLLTPAGESCAAVCGGVQSVDLRLTVNGASSEGVVRALDRAYQLDTSYFDELGEPCHTAWFEPDATVYSYIEQGAHDGHGGHKDAPL